jgi:hypothetical protein
MCKAVASPSRFSHTFLLHRAVVCSISVYLCLSVASPAQAALDPELKTPYQLRVVLQIADHRALTPVFQQQLQRELAGQLQLTYGPLARVEVVRVHRLLKDVRARGLQALDDWGELSEFKTHFVLLNYADGRYLLQARQHDGMTGMASPVIRYDQTAEPRLVARTAARLVDRDFGLTGTVTRVEGDDVAVAIKGGELGVPLTRWIRPGEVFAIARVSTQGGKQQATRLESAVLLIQEEPREGVCRCKLFHRLKRDSLGPEPGVEGYRCLKLTTLRGPVRLRLISDDREGKPVNRALVHVSSVGYGPKDPGKDRTTGVDGLIVTPEEFDNVAFVRISKGGQLRAKFPVEIVDGRTLVYRINDRAVASGLDELYARRDDWVRRAQESFAVLNSRIADVNEALGRSLEAGFTATRRAIKGIKSDMDTLYAERTQILADARASGLDMSEGDLILQKLGEGAGMLEKRAAEQEALIKEATSPERRELESKLQRARLLEAQADFEQAIRLYESVLARVKDAQVAKYLQKLKKAWTIPEGDEAHARAREFIYNTWSRLDAAGVKAEMSQAFQAFKVLRDRGDRLTAQKLHLTNFIHAKTLTKRIEALSPNLNKEDVRAELKAFLKAKDELFRLRDEVEAFLGVGKAPAKGKGQEQSAHPQTVPVLSRPLAGCVCYQRVTFPFTVSATRKERA